MFGTADLKQPSPRSVVSLGRSSPWDSPAPRGVAGRSTMSRMCDRPNTLPWSASGSTAEKCFAVRSGNFRSGEAVLDLSSMASHVPNTSEMRRPPTRAPRPVPLRSRAGLGDPRPGGHGAVPAWSGSWPRPPPGSPCARNRCKASGRSLSYTTLARMRPPSAHALLDVGR